MLVDLRARVGFDTWMIARGGGGYGAVLAAIGDPVPDIDSEGGSWSCLVEGELPFVVGDLRAVPGGSAARRWSSADSGACVAVAIPSIDGSSLGVLGAVGPALPAGGLDQLVATVQAQADVIGMLLSFELRTADAHRRAERLEALALGDPLTGVANRRAWEIALGAESARASRYGNPASVIVVDLDGLKEVNDHAGHRAGDVLLRHAAAVLTGRCRSTDFVARVAGDEFAMLLPETGPVDSEEVASQIDNVFMEAGIAAAVGVSSLRRDGDLWETWSDADTAMYARKVERRMERAGMPRPGVGPLVGMGQKSDITESEEGVGVTRSTEALNSIDALLCLAKDQLGMNVAFINRFDGDNSEFRNVASHLKGGLVEGATGPRCDTYCQLLVDGTIDQVVPDTADHPALAALPVTAALEIGAFVGVPLRRRNGDLYGTLCAFSQRHDHRLRPRDANVLEVIGHVIMTLLDHEDRHGTDRHEVLTRLDSLYETGGPTMVFQPIIDLEQFTVIGMEALSRFPVDSPTPLAWFAAAERAEVGTKLQLRAIVNAVAELDAIPGFLAVNASPSAISTPSFLRRLTELPLHRLVLELTELSCTDDYKPIQAALEPLREQGLRLAIDDVGAGYSNMQRVLALSPDLLKLDASLIRNLETDLARQSLVTALSTFAADTGAGVIAEGIETQHQLEYLRSIHVAYGQGYLLGRPGPLNAAGQPELAP